MATERPKQLNVRLEEEYWAMLDQLVPVISADLEINVTNADVVRLGLKCLAKRYLEGDQPKKGKAK
jgi:hypothetical protein